MTTQILPCDFYQNDIHQNIQILKHFWAECFLLNVTGPLDTHTHTHTQTQAHTHTHTTKHTNTQTHTCIYTPIHTHSHAFLIKLQINPKGLIILGHAVVHQHSDEKHWTE